MQKKKKYDEWSPRAYYHDEERLSRLKENHFSWRSILNEIPMGILWHIPGGTRAGMLLTICTAAAGADLVGLFLLNFVRKKKGCAIEKMKYILLTSRESEKRTCWQPGLNSYKQSWDEVTPWLYLEQDKIKPLGNHKKWLNILLLWLTQVTAILCQVTIPASFILYENYIFRDHF